MSPALSVIIPCFNEENRLAGTVVRVHSYLSQIAIEHDFILIDDGSTDGTRQIFENLAEQLEPAPLIKVLGWKQNLGKGAAVRAGLEAARGDWLLLMDADLSCPIEEFPKLWNLRLTGDLIVGSRRASGSLVEIKQPWIRTTLGKGYSWFSRSLFQLPVSDVTCGFKLFHAAAMQPLLQLARINRWSYDTELLVIATRNGLRLSEAGVRWNHCAGSKVRVGRDVFASLLENMKIALTLAGGGYRLR